jgi:hypothetical protein
MGFVLLGLTETFRYVTEVFRHYTPSVTNKLNAVEKSMAFSIFNLIYSSLRKWIEIRIAVVIILVFGALEAVNGQIGDGRHDGFDG